MLWDLIVILPKPSSTKNHRHWNFSKTKYIDNIVISLKLVSMSLKY